MFRWLIRRKKKKETHVATESPTALEELPVEVKRHIASFLSVRDLLKFSETSKRINRDLDIVVVSSPLTDRVSQNKAFSTGSTTQCFAAVIPNQEESHSHLTTFAFHVVTPPSIHATPPSIEGTIWVVEQDLPSNQSPDVLKSLAFGRGKSVAKTIVTSINGEVHLSFFPKTGKFYQLWVRTRGYDDNWYRLRLSNMMLHHVGLATKPSRRVAFQFEVRLRQRVRNFGFTG